MTQTVLHLTTRLNWVAAQRLGHYKPESFEKDGFIHCSTPAQISRVANLLYSGQHGLVLLVIDPKRLESELRWEPGEDVKTELFPHIYGPIALGAVSSVLDFEPDAEGHFALNAALNS